MDCFGGPFFLNRHLERPECPLNQKKKHTVAAQDGPRDLSKVTGSKDLEFSPTSSATSVAFTRPMRSLKFWERTTSTSGAACKHEKTRWHQPPSNWIEKPLKNMEGWINQ